MPKNYNELVQLPTFEERFDYLSLQGKVGEPTFGRDRWLNQVLYRSRRWRQVRNEVLIRDEGCDLAVPGLEIFERASVHHMIALSLEDIERGASIVFDPDYLITVSHRTHMDIHYGYKRQRIFPVERMRGDTNLW